MTATVSPVREFVNLPRPSLTLLKSDDVLVRFDPVLKPTVADILRMTDPDEDGLTEYASDWRRRNKRHIYRHLWVVRELERLRRKGMDFPILMGYLHLANIRKNGQVERLGLASIRVVTTAGVNSIRDGFAGTFTLSNYDYHAIGTGTNAEAVGDTALQTELTTQYNPDNTRATGTASSPATGDYRSSGQNTVDASVAITEHGLMSQAATGGGTLLDRSVFAADNLVSGDSITTQYDIVFPAGS